MELLPGASWVNLKVQSPHSQTANDSPDTEKSLVVKTGFSDVESQAGQ
jgi:hypothetical protein